jgi:hypothetical protein
MMVDVEIPGKPSAFTYVGLPVSGGGVHGLGRTSLREAYERTVAFLDACTTVVSRPSPFFSIHDFAPLPEWGATLREQFGGGDDTRITVGGDRVEEALAFLDFVDPQPANRYGVAPLWFTMSWSVKVLDPATATPLSGQDPTRFAGVDYDAGVPLGTSRVRLILSNRAAVGVALCLPDIDERYLHEMLPWLQAHAPFRFSAKHWRRWSATQSGTFRARRVEL